MIEALFGSKTRVKLLHLFLNNPGRAFYVREITRKIDEQINSVRRELANMLSVGIIRSETSNNRLYYEVNEDYQYYRPLRDIFSDSDETSEAVSEAASANDWGKRLRKLGDVRLVIFAGSLVKGSAANVDVLIVGNVVKTQTKNFIKELEEEERSSLNYSVMEYDDFNYRLSIRDRFVRSVLDAKHTVIYDTENILKQEEE